ncbi:MAG: GDP-mannose 4,6-dehydratase [Candidatus Omnitrophica bacterium]|nr:GDP-mannose 4,6-dehydratase [Candidatus Omnitrophota bacterium]
MKVLITGIAGFVGSHFTEFFLKRKNIQVYGIERWKASTENIEHLKDKIDLYDECDINDIVSMRDILKKTTPDYIIHLAAQSFVPTSWTAPAETIKTNIIGEVNLFEALRSLKLNPRIIVAGSSEEYGFVKKEELPIRETNPLRPLSPYAVSKIGQDFLGYQYYKSYGMNIIRTRAFNHTGPRRGESFVTSNFAKQIAMIEKGKQKPVILVGSLSAKRDFTDVRDMVKAYWAIMQKGVPGEVYNICSGRTYAVQEVLDMLLSFTKKRVTVKKDPARMRPSDVPVLLGDCTKMKKITGWEPEIPFKKTLEDLLDYWRRKL